MKEIQNSEYMCTQGRAEELATTNKATSVQANKATIKDTDEIKKLSQSLKKERKAKKEALALVKELRQATRQLTIDLLNSYTERTYAQAIVKSKHTMTLREFAEFLNDLGNETISVFSADGKMDESILIGWLREMKVIDEYNIPAEEYIKKGWFVIIPRTDFENGKWRTSMTLRVTGVGQINLICFMSDTK